MVNTPLNFFHEHTLKFVSVDEDSTINGYGIGFRCDVKIVSDANSFFIETILKHHGVWKCFSEIICNPSHVKEGSLNICPYHDYLKSSHGCNLCPPNMCKAIASSLNIYLLIAMQLTLTCILVICSYCFEWFITLLSNI